MNNYVSAIFENNLPLTDNTAVVDQNGKRETSWKELYQKSCAVARHAASLNLKGLIPVCMPRCVETVEVLFGLGLAGLGVAPLSDHTPDERIATIEEQTSNRTWTMAQYNAAMNCGTEAFAPVDFSDDEPAYVVYTSGSTGTPKGVMLSNAIIERTYKIVSGPQILDLQKDDIMLQATSFAFVVFIANMFVPLYSGVVTHILPDEARLDIALMEKYINAHNITKMYLTAKPLSRLGDVPSMRIICSGAERVSQIGPNGYKLLNVWGMSETAGPTAVRYEVTEPMDNTPIGKPVEDCRCYILDENGNLSDEGELCVSGPVALGYYKRPDLTAQTFTPNPFSDDEGHRTLLHSGDIVRRLPDGNLLYLNRKDFMIKINGQRVEPGEAEAVVRHIEGVKDAVVKGFTEDDGYAYLCAYYVSDEEIPESDLRAALEKALPSYMIPSFYVRLDAIPLNANGKADRKNLRPPKRSALQGEYAAPENEAERALCRAFETVLRIDRVGATDDFFRLGGDSIRAMTVVSRAKLSGLTPSAIMTGRTPRGIAEIIEKQADEAYADLPDNIEKAPLTDSQMGIYLACAAAPESVKYNIPFAVTFERTEKMTAEYVTDCVDKVICAHPALYSRLEVNGENVYMCRCAMPEEGICAVEEAETFSWDDFVRPFDMTLSELCRAKAVLTKDKVYVMLDTHHVVSDGKSISILVDELCSAFDGEEIKKEKVDAFAIYEVRQRVSPEKLERAKTHFANILSGVETESNLLSDHKSEKIDAPAEIILLNIDDIDFTRLNQNGITLSTFFMTVFGYALAKMTGQSESLFGVAENGRPSAALDSTVSMMVRTLPVYINIDENKSADELMLKTQEQFFASIENDVVPFAELVKEYGINADVLFVYQSDTLSGGERTPVEFCPTGSAFSNIDVSVFKYGSSHTVKIEYRSDLYERKTIERFAEVFTNAARAFASGLPLDEIKLIGVSDKVFLDNLNKTESPCDLSETIIDLFKKQAAAQPDKVLVTCEDCAYTYKQADEITDRIAQYIHAQGIGAGQVVSVLIHRSVYIVLASIGVMKAGAMYQPLDPSYPSDRLTFMREDASSALLIADRDLMSLLPGFDGKVLYIDQIPALPEAHETIVPPTADDSYILLYTSGTTGKPKGCMFKHSNLRAMTHAYALLTEMNADSVAAAYASYGFDADMSDIYPAISMGGSVVIVPESIRLDLTAIRDYIVAHRATHLMLTTQLCVQFVLQYRELPYLKYLIGGGEKMVPLEPPISYKLINGYGPTETTTMETQFTVDKYYDDIPVGKAIANTKLYVVDAFKRRVPVGVPGELIIAGPQVSKGYLNRPEQTAKVFVPNTFEENVAPGYERCYRTGDVVRYVDDGNLMFIGRRDMQVKIRGFRIELSEVERVIRDFPGIKNATVIARDSSAGGKVLNAYIVSDEKIDIEAMNDYIRSVKPPYMVPAATMQIDEIPLTVNGKVDKRKLPEMKAHFENVLKPVNELQKRLFDNAATAIGTSDFGTDTDLFMAGLSSLGSIRLCSLLAEEFGIHVKIRDLKKYPTILKLEAFVEKSLSKNNKPQAETKEAEAARYAPDHPISKTMEGIFAECVGKPDSTFYNLPYLAKLADTIDEDRLKNALASAVEAHAYIKVELFYDSEGRVRQHAKLDDAFTAEMVETITAESIASIRETLVKPFWLTDNRLFRLAIIHADGLYLFMDIHHIIFDGTSVSVFMNDVEKAYAGEKLIQEAYCGFDVADDEQASRTEEDMADAKAYYENLFEDTDKSFLPLMDKYPHMTPSSGLINYSLHYAALDAVKTYCAKNRVSLNAFFVSAFGFVLSRYAGMDYSVFNTIYNGRNDSRTHNICAMLVKTLPVVCRTDKTSTGELVKEMSSQLMDSMANDLYSYAEIVRAFDINNDVMFIYQGEGFVRETFCQGKTELVPMKLSDSKTPLSLQVVLKNGEIDCELEYDSTRFTENLMRAFISAFDMACAAFALDKKINAVSLVSEEAEEIMERFNETEWEYDRGRTITDMFLENVKLRPEKLCIAYIDRRVSYGEAGKLTGKLARYLMEKGIGKNDYVPILINRTESMVITAHGVVRAGAAYLGLDPTYPADRLKFMIEDCGAKIVIADRRLMDKIPDYLGDTLYLDEIDALPDMDEATEAAFRAQEKFKITPENDALVVYSSGTTGLPKGSVLQHKAIVCYYHNYTRNCEIDENANVATYASFGFDGGAMDVFCSPMAGASLFVIPDEIRLDLNALEQFYTRNAITTGFITTQVGTMFIANTKCRTLKHFMVGGEKFIPVMAPEWVCFQNGYGPSETMCYVNRYNVRDTGSLQPIGIPSDNIKEYIIDKFGNRLPVGACGELCISGGQLGRGYLNRPEKTAEVFVNNPFSDKDDYRKMYRTGDVVRLLPDGNYDFVGRRDGQVKIRGFRVELTEVEGRIREFEGIEKAVVAAFDNPAGGKFLAAYIVSEKPVDIEKLKAFIAAEKPDYMVPVSITRLDAIPLTSNGKIDTRKLPKPEMKNVKKGAEPADETEEKICAIFGSVLGLDKVYADDDFFAVGGTSITAIQVIVKCEHAGIPIVYKNLFANPTAKKLAAFLREGSGKDISANDLEKADGYNYSALKYNIVDNLRQIKNEGVGDVLLTGATGFLGSHVFRELLESTSGKVICIVRSKAGLPADERLEMMMVYYFDEWYRDELRAHVTVIDGSIEDDDTMKKLEDIHFDTIINCAANVKHFAAGDEMVGANVTGVEKLIELAEKTNARLIQTSSLSVSGESVNGSIPSGFVFKETDLNIGQSLENKYIYTKYLAERALIDAVSNGRIRGKIIRLGNLMARAEDSEFQVNAGTNGFLRMFFGFAALGCVPLSVMDSQLEFSPIDAVAKAVVLLSGTPDAFTVFHAKNCNTIHYGYFAQAIRNNGKPIEIVEDEVFEERLNKALEREENATKLGGLLSYRNTTSTMLDDFKSSETAEVTETRVKIASDTTFTTKALYRLGFAWPLISEEYLNKMVKTLMEMNYFEE